jgi:pimeloyl-ACP methyl ester carboxylesterase
MAIGYRKFGFLLGILLLIQLILLIPVQAKTMVLIHGYLADGMSWRTTKVTQGLKLAGWKDGGGYRMTKKGMVTPRNPLAAPNAFFTVDLSSKSSIEAQAYQLAHYLNHLYALRKEPIIFVGHSAGGIVARFYLITPAHVPAQALITIGTPHLGTPTADFALLTSHSPVAMMLKATGQDTIRDSCALYTDLKQAQPNSFLYRLNQQPHPAIVYVSVIRSNKSKTKPNKYDFFVSPESQNMNNVWALQGRSLTYLTQENHFLSGKDGLFLVDILMRLSTLRLD